MGAPVPAGLAIERRGRVHTIWFDRPERRNAFTAEMRDALPLLVEEADRDPEVAVIVLRGRGGTFCAGADLQRVEGDLGHGDTTERIIAGAALLTRVAQVATPTVAVIEGFAVAGGFEIMLACDLAIAAADSSIGDVHIRRGLVGGAGPLYRLPRLVGLRRAKELMLTGMTLSGTQAHEWGLVNRVVEAGEDLDAAVDAFVSTLLDKSPVAVRATNRALERALETDSETMRLIERMTVAEVFGSADAREGVAAFLEGRAPRWSGR